MFLTTVHLLLQAVRLQRQAGLGSRDSKALALEALGFPPVMNCTIKAKQPTAEQSPQTNVLPAPTAGFMLLRLVVTVGQAPTHNRTSIAASVQVAS